MILHFVHLQMGKETPFGLLGPSRQTRPSGQLLFKHGFLTYTLTLISFFSASVHACGPRRGKTMTTGTDSLQGFGLQTQQLHYFLRQRNKVYLHLTNIYRSQKAEIQREESPGQLRSYGRTAANSDAIWQPSALGLRSRQAHSTDRRREERGPN